MADEKHRSKRRGFCLHDVPGTTVALTSLAILGGAALLTTPLWLWYRHKRKRADALARQSVTTEVPSGEQPGSIPAAAGEPAKEPEP
jgi:hypothetical protein